MNDFTRNAADDRDLLRRYAEDEPGAEDAFRQLAERYSGLVYGTTMRRLANPEWAADATQNVFAALATKAPALVKENIPSVGAWLHRAATFESRRVRRDQIRKQQRQSMIRNELSATGGDTSADWNEIRPELDAALQKLPVRDRDILVLHYFEGMTFRDIAERLGIGAEAAQKRGARALEKLSRLLRSRGATASTLMLAAGLGSELAQAAPASLVTKISIATKATSSTTALITAMSATSKTTISTVIAALAILAVSVGSGYLIGDSTPSPTTAAKPPGLSTDKPIASPMAESANGRGEEPPAASAADRFVGEIERFIGERKQLMSEGQGRQTAGETDQGLDEIFAKMELLIDRTTGSADSLNPGDFESVLESLDAHSSDETKHIGRRFLLVAWGKRDPLAALEAAREHTPGSESIIFNGWGESDPAAALKKQQELAEGDRQLGREALAELYRGWLTVDATTALGAFQQLDFDDQKALFKVFGSLTKMPSARAKMLEAIPKIPDEKLRAELVREVGGDWAEYSPTRVFEWFDSIRFENPRATVAAVHIIYNSATKRGQNMEAAADWIWPHLPPDQKGPFLNREIEGNWKRSNPEAVAAWLAKHEIVSGEQP